MKWIIKRWVASLFLVTIVMLLSMCRKAEIFSENGYDDRLSGGEATTFVVSTASFGQSIDALSGRDADVHDLGDKAFESVFVETGTVNIGLGGIYNNVSCISCHHMDARGTPTMGEANSGMFLRISIGNDAEKGPISASGYGTQLRDKAILGAVTPVKTEVSYTESATVLTDGENCSLRIPTYNKSNWYTGAEPIGAQYSPRLAPSVFGLGLLEAVDESTILSFADEDDRDNDGVSGRPNYVYDGYQKRTMVGRFGLKANNATLLSQNAGAYNGDIGITNYVFPATDGSTELADSIVNAVTFYIRTLAVPARRDVMLTDVKQGKSIFLELGCGKCHIPSMRTGTSLIKQLSNQRIQPFTDLLLHDMGAGLADGRADFKATGSEWRTAPLWGIGLLKRVNGYEFYLHDGRARTLTEAIMWHGGEAEKAKENFSILSKSKRDLLLSFLKSL